MRDNILLTYLVADVLFVVSGGLLIVFALTTESEEHATPKKNDIARNLLLNMCPLSGQLQPQLKLCGNANRNSCDRECRSCFRYFLGVDTCYHTTYDTRMVEAPRIHGRRLWLVHHDSWSYCLV